MRFKRVIMDASATDRSPNPPVEEGFKRVVFCTGKVGLDPISLLLNHTSCLMYTPHLINTPVIISMLSEESLTRVCAETCGDLEVVDIIVTFIVFTFFGGVGHYKCGLVLPCNCIREAFLRCSHTVHGYGYGRGSE